MGIITIHELVRVQGRHIIEVCYNEVVDMGITVADALTMRGLRRDGS
jgi:hypothetical protein